ncbi:tRNA adenosine deaminase-associated protein [Kitasatospora sp. McL0602]|uniref:tRNA adenosine deaminase-associated protein n=1 Tax=Kitasatospora sp. McL0602 TaxID=3439530 RepID=UPI003F8CC2CA
MYFAAVLARTDDGWEASEPELDNVETVADLADLARDSARDDDTVLVLIEQEDTWFAILRVDGEEDPRIFVSDAAAAARSSYGSMLTDELIGRDDDEDFDDLDDLVADPDDEDGEAEPDEDDVRADSGPAGAVGPLGDPELLADLGVTAPALRALDGDAITVIADALGCTEVLEAVR